jgi:hypothetical protein
MASMKHVFDRSTTGTSVAEVFSSAIKGKSILITGINVSFPVAIAIPFTALFVHSPVMMLI